MKKTCDPVEVIKINLNNSNIQTHELDPCSSICYSNLKVEGKTITIPNSAPLDGTVIVENNKKIKIYLFQRNEISPPAILRSSHLLHLFSTEENCVASFGTFKIPPMTVNIQFLLIGAGGNGGHGGHGGHGSREEIRKGSAGGGGGASGSPGGAGKILFHRIEGTELGFEFTYRTGLTGKCKFALRNTIIKLPDGTTLSAAGGLRGGDGGHGGNADLGTPGDGGLPRADSYAGGKGGAFFKSGLNGNGSLGGIGGETFALRGGGGGGGGGTKGGTVEFVGKNIIYKPGQLAVVGGGNGGSGRTIKDGQAGDNAPVPKGATPYGFGGNGGGGAAVFGIIGAGGEGAGGAYGGQGVIILYYEI